MPYLNQANEYFLQKSFKHRANFEEYEEKLKNERDDRQKIIDDNEVNQREYILQLNNVKSSIEMYKNDSDYTKNKYNSVKHDLEVEKFVVSRYRNPKSKVLSTVDSDILEHFNDLNEIRFFDLQRRQMISKHEAFELLYDKEMDINTTEYEVKKSIGIMNSVIK
ncbi:hypothetical protein AB4Y90_09670 [Chryseobacterium sp. 2TAF14]|uniref:hypothetical protein n=1 Tax=Chryseobacterium sp. 2TAF14 TaxID=3233007 RepID=UPI003F8DC7C9